ncbi:MAG: hypothetical protein EOO65_00870 [Methanosarcinales archaeon]|nr:MAG: hypothetical protein EOO65_00870 [Methanosarcinales archaeon]
MRHAAHCSLDHAASEAKDAPHLDGGGSETARHDDAVRPTSKDARRRAARKAKALAAAAAASSSSSEHVSSIAGSSISHDMEGSSVHGVAASASTQPASWSP